MVALCQESPHDNGKEPDVTFFFRHWRENSLYVASAGPQHPDFGRFRGPAHGLQVASSPASWRENKPRSRQIESSCHRSRQAPGLVCMRNGDYHGAITEADLALRTARVRAFPPPFLLWYWVAYCTFSTPPCSVREIPRSRYSHATT